MRRRTVASLAALLFLANDVLSASGSEQVEHYLRTAEVLKIRALGEGVTLSNKVELSDGTVTRSAVFKTIDEYQPIKHFDDGGFPELGFRDSYKNEIAAYELDKLLGLGMVPATVERKIRGDVGSLQVWVDDAIGEGDRRRKGLSPPDAALWNTTIYKVRLFHQLIYDADYENLKNILVKPDFSIAIIDSSRAFRTQKKILHPEYLRQFSRTLLDRMKALDQQTLEASLGKYLSKQQRASLLIRRDLLVRLAEERAAKHGEAMVFYE